MRASLYLLKELLLSALNFKSVILSGLAVLICFVFLSALAVGVLQGSRDLFGRVEIVAVLKDDTPSDEINKLHSEIQSWREVYDVDYVPKETAKKPSSKGYLVIMLKDLEDAKSVAASLHSFTQIESVRAPKMSFLRAYLPKIPQQEAVFWGTLAVLFLLAIAMIQFAIGALLKNFAGQIEILKISGVSPGTIRLPFVLVGMLYGLIGALGSVAVFYLVPVGFEEAHTQFRMALSSGGLGVLLGAIGGFIRAKASI